MPACSSPCVADRCGDRGSWLRTLHQGNLANLEWHLDV